ncbi:MAG: hypothetical protein RLZZ519_3213, partial [Bacteroidota bacterium]
LCLFISPSSGFSQLLRDGSFEFLGGPNEPGLDWTFCVGDPDAQVLDGSGPGIFGIHTPPSDGQKYVGLMANNLWFSEELGQAMQLEAGMHYYGSVDLFRSMAHQNWNGTARLEIWGGDDCSHVDELLWTSGTVNNLDEWQTYSINFAPLFNHPWVSVRCQLVAGSGEMTYLCADALRLDNVFFSVDYLSFAATTTENNVALAWTTPDLEDAVNFEVEWSADGQAFSKLGQIPATAGESMFQFDHADAHPGSQFYRIRSIDRGGHEVLSEVVQAIVGPEQSTFFPNPASDQMTIVAPAEIGSIALLDLAGRTLLT